MVTMIVTRPMLKSVCEDVSTHALLICGRCEWIIIHYLRAWFSDVDLLPVIVLPLIFVRLNISLLAPRAWPVLTAIDTRQCGTEHEEGACPVDRRDGCFV